jgi:hypothetical protein
MYQFDVELNGDAVDFPAPITVTIRETGINTGIFEAEFDMQDIPGDLSDGDDLKISVDDFMADVNDADEDEVTITIGKATVGVDFSRTTVPIPPGFTSATKDEVGPTMVTTLQLVDPSLATQSNVEELVNFTLGTDENEWVIEVEGDEVNSLTVESNDDFFDADGICNDDAGEARIVSGISLCEVMGIADEGDLENFLDETGKATGVFEAELEFHSPTGMDVGDWQDAEITFTYTTDESDEESAGITFRGNDAIVSVDQPTAKTGTMVTISVEDQDLNLDDGDTESFKAQGDLLLIETDDEDIQDLCPTATISAETFEETGDDTGVFSAEFEVGNDIPITCLDGDTVESAGTIVITYDDEIDSTGGNGDEIEFNIALATATGGIQVSPTLVGPATEITVLITDLDLDDDSDSTDEYETPDGSSDDFFVSFASSRNEVDEGSPDIEETGPNTGVFMFTLELITDEEGCQDDDLDGGTDKFKADSSGTDASIGACPGDLISIKYDDEHTANGGSATISEIVEVKSFDPEFKADKDSYTVGDRVTISISDPDANRKSDIADSLRDIRVTSDSDRVGEEFSAIETGRDTGVFKLSFGTASGSQSGSISVKNGDDITVKYTDDFPADFEEQEEDKDFEFSVPVGGVAGGKAAVSPPEPQDVTGKRLTQINSGQQVVLTTNVVNQGANSQPFVALIEVRDSSDVTVYLAWQTGTLNPNGQTNVGLSWTPDQAGNYEVRTFVISSLAKPDILSPVAKTPITVS